jgi:hypothetical protein
VKGGYVRLILTTNFDRLTERAIEALGIIPAVISSPEDLAGASPLVHSQCSIVKLHGDYLDLGIKSTKRELSTYDKRIDDMLDRIFDEFGLIVCGWSAVWDIALRAALMRRKSQRYSIYWTFRGNLQESLAAHSGAELDETMALSEPRFLHKPVKKSLLGAPGPLFVRY